MTRGQWVVNSREGILMGVHSECVCVTLNHCVIARADFNFLPG